MDEQALICMNCGHANLFYLHCKIRCENCGFLLDCSDLDVGGEVKRATLAASKRQGEPAYIAQPTKPITPDENR